jgi:hypothetical protein
VLAAFDVDRADPCLVAQAISRACEGRAHLTLIWTWRPTRFLGFTAIGGDDPAAPLERHEHEAAERLHNCLKEVPHDICVRALLLRGSLATHLIKELRTKHYDELILAQPLRARTVARVRRIAPDLNVLFV